MATDALDYETRQLLRRVVSDRLREQAPYVEGGHHDPPRGPGRKAIEERVAEQNLKLAALAATVATTADRYGLTLRESQVLALVCVGLIDKEIAGRLFLSRDTVRQHIHSMFRKLGARNRTHAAVLTLTVDSPLLGMDREQATV